MNKSKVLKITLFTILFILSAAGAFATSFYFLQYQDQKTSAPATPEVSVESAPSKPADSRASFVATGDNLIHGAIYDEAKKRSTTGGYDFDYAYQHTAPYFKDFDFKYINQETLVNDAHKPSHYPRFSTPLALGDKVVDMGFNIINTANNHSYDQGPAGVKSSYKYWDSKKPDVVHIGFYTGNDEVDVKYLTKNGIKLGLIACTYATNGLTMTDPESPYIINCDDYPQLERLVKVAQKNSDSVVVSAHWGNEDNTTISDYQREVADKLSTMGVDAIIGNHPHVIQSIEWHKSSINGHKTLICYSLGNFISAQFPAKNLVGGLFQFEIVKHYEDADNFTINYENPKFVPVVTHYDPNGSHTKNIRNYLLRDYTDELSANHGARSRGFSRDYAYKLVRELIPAEFLKLD